MSQFEDREKAFEAKFHVDEELVFKVNARRDKLLGLWAAAKIGLSGDAVESYARKIVESGLADSQHETMLAKLAADLAGAKVAVTTAQIRMEMDRLASVAHKQIMEELSTGQQTFS